MHPYIYADEWAVQPFNGQVRRYAQIRKFAETFLPTICIETGTYFGTSTPHLASMVAGKTFTIEVNVENFKKASKRFELNYPMFNIECILGDSAIEMQGILDSLDPLSEKVIAYLDAHWLDAIPTREELEILINWGGEWIAVVDDFFIPDQPGYGFDQYKDVVIGITQIPRGSGLEVYVPSESSTYETGARRGTGYILSSQLRRSLPEEVFTHLRLISS